MSGPEQCEGKIINTLITATEKPAWISIHTRTQIQELTYTTHTTHTHTHSYTHTHTHTHTQTHRHTNTHTRTHVPIRIAKVKELGRGLEVPRRAREAPGLPLVDWLDCAGCGGIMIIHSVIHESTIRNKYVQSMCKNFENYFVKYE
jgi:hypothetical protein